MNSYHEWETDGGCFVGFDNPETGKACHLNGGEQVNPSYGNLSKENQVRLILGGHEQNQNSSEHLSRERKFSSLTIKLVNE